MSFNSIFGLGSHTGYDTLRGWWPLQETTGTTAYDYGISGFHGTISGMGANPTTGTGPTSWLSTAFTFDDTDNIVAISKEVAVKGNGERTIGGWIYPNVQDNANHACEIGDGNNGNSFRIRPNVGNCFEYGGGYLTGVAGIDIIPTTGWTFVSVHYPEVTGTMYSSGLRLCVDTAQADVWEIAKRTINTTFTKADVYIGGAPNKNAGEWFDGKLASWFIFGKDMTTSEMLEIYSGPEPINYQAPSISGNPIVGNTLTCNPGTWGLDTPFSGNSNGTISYQYQWYSNGEIISGQTGSSYTISESDIGSGIKVLVSASNDGGNDSSANTFSQTLLGLATSSPYASGGLHITSGDYYIHIFTESSNFQAFNNLEVEYLLIGGGGGGGMQNGGGGGAGGLLTNITGSLLSVNAGLYQIVVGYGGNGAIVNGTGQNGKDSSFNGIVAYGGGYGGGDNNVGLSSSNGGNGGCGGGGAEYDLGATSGIGGTGTINYNGGNGYYNGGSAGGGGGGGGAGQSGKTATSNIGGAGGNGLQINITGVNTYYAGGGGGGRKSNGTAAVGGLGGGGMGADRSTTAQAGTNGLGGGGGGGGGSGGTGPGHAGRGGDGLVVIRYMTPSSQNYIYEMNTRVYV